MFRTAVAFTALTTLSLVSAQSNSNSTFKLPNPTSVDLGTRSSWCNAQGNACGDLCVQVKDESCDVDTLDFSCICSNDESPDFNLYTDTVPYFVCKQLYQDCITDHPNDATGQKNCTTTYDDNCGTESPANATKIDAQTSTSAASSSTASSEATGAGSSEATTTSSEAGAMPTNMPIQHIGNGVAAVAVGIFAYML